MRYLDLKKYLEKSSVQNKRIRRIHLKRFSKDGNWLINWNNNYHKISKEFNDIIKQIEGDYLRFRTYNTVIATLNYFVSNKYEKELEKYRPLIFRRVKLSTNSIYYKRDDKHNWPCNSWIPVKFLCLPIKTNFPRYIYIITDIRFVVSHNK